MATENNLLQAVQAGQPEPPAAVIDPGQSAATQAQPGSGEPQYVTKEELDRATKEVLRQAQSMTGKLNNAIQQKLEALQKAGVTNATPAMAQAMIDAETSQQAQAPATEAVIPAQGQPSSVPQNADPVLAQAQQWLREDQVTNPDPFTLEAYRIMAERGTRITDNDPEAKTIDTSSPGKFFSTLEQAIEAKREREGKIGSPARTPTVSGGSPSSQPAHAGLSGVDTLDQYFKSKSFG